MGSTSSKESPAGKPSYFTIMQGKWGGPWKLVLTPAELEALPEELRAATLSIRAKIGRRNLAYPMPVGAHRCVRACVLARSIRIRNRPIDYPAREGSDPSQLFPGPPAAARCGAATISTTSW